MFEVNYSNCFMLYLSRNISCDYVHMLFEFYTGMPFIEWSWTDSLREAYIDRAGCQWSRKDFAFAAS